MLKINVFRSFTLFKKFELLKKINIRYLCELNFDSEEEIVKNVLGKIMILGMNLPDNKNVLNEIALQKLTDCIKSIDKDDEVSTAILCGHGGNFCNGIVSSTEATDLSNKLIKALYELKKPIIGALDGSISGFGLFLAVMCDIRVMDNKSVIKLQIKDKIEMQPFLYERLVFNIGVAKTLELLTSQTFWSANDCQSSGFISKMVDVGCALGTSVLIAQSMSFHNSVESIIETKAKIYSILSKKV